MKNRSTFETFLDRHARIGIDTSPFVYHVHDHAAYTPVTTLLFRAIEEGGISAVTSTVSMLELLVLPLRMHATEAVKTIYGLSARYPRLAWIEVTLPLAAEAARLRAHYNLHTPDAIQVATAIEARATGFVTNDRRLSRVMELDVLVLDDVLS